MPFKLTNTSSYSRRNGETDWWDWTAHIESTPPDSLDEVAYVEYHLHPTFRNPVRRVREREGGFPLETRGWGTFELRARVVFKDKTRTPHLLSHELAFEDAVDANGWSVHQV